MPCIDPKNGQRLISVDRVQDTNSCEAQYRVSVTRAYCMLDKPRTNNVIQPVVVLVARFKDDAKMQTASRLRRARRLDEDVGAIICLQVVSCIGREDASLRVVDAPVGSDI